MPAENRSADDSLLADAGIGPDDRPVHDRVLLDVALPADDAVGGDARAGFDYYTLIDEAWRFDDRALFDLGLWRNPRLLMAVVERCSAITSVHDVAMHLLILLRRADVNPVAAIHVRDERFVPIDERREKTALDRPRHVFWDAIERVGFEHVDPRVDRVAGNFVGVRLFEKTPYVAVVIR